MQKLVCFFFFLLLISSVTGQQVNVFMDETENKSFFGIHGGISFPAGLYASKDPYNSGFALPGPGVSVESAWFFSKWIGIGGRADYNRHFANAGAMEVAYLNLLESGSTLDISFSGTYTIATAMMGVFSNMPLNRWMQLTGKALFGPFYVATPQYTLIYHRSFLFYGQTLEENWQEIHSSGNHWEFSYLVGVGVRFKPSNTWSFNLCFDYSESYQEIPYESYSEGVMYDELGVPFNGSGKESTSMNRNFRYMLFQGGFSLFF